MNKHKAWAWVPTLYYAEGIPYVVVMTVSVIMYKRLDISNTDIALYTSWLYLPWVIKPLWSPLVDMFRTKRFWITTMQLLLGAALAGVALTIPTDDFFRYTLAFFWLMAFSSATHDIAADGFYMLGLEEHQQAFFVGIRSTFYRLAMITGQGLIIILAGFLEAEDGWLKGNITLAWSITFGLLGGMMLLFFLYHQFMLPRTAKDRAATPEDGNPLSEFLRTFVLFFQKKRILAILGFLLLYRFGEAQLVKLASPFLLDPPDKGGLGLDTSEVGLIYGTIGIIALTLGGILGGLVVSRQGLKFWLWWMLAAINLPNAVYVFLSFVQPESFITVSAMVAIEQFGYGFGFTAYMLFMIYISEGEHKTAHFAITTGFMALGMMLPGMFSGWLPELVGYQWFFVWVVLCAIPGFLVAFFIPLEANFGKKERNA
jgi:PAT family beta-lactamase induction signal transducer AmpG